MGKKKDCFMDYYNSLNNNKIFAGVIILIMNISSRYATLELSKSQEYYVKYIFGKQLLLFAIIWIGTRDIFISLVLTIVFLLLANYLLNDQSKYCIIPSNCKVPPDSETITEKDINDSIRILKIAHSKKKTNDSIIENTLYKENFI
jgi:hypothetical protein